MRALHPCIIILIHFITSTSAKPDYEVLSEGAKVISYNADYISNIKIDLVKINKAAFKISASFKILQTINMDAARGSGQIYVYDNNEYRLQPMKLTRRVCSEYKKQTYIEFTEIEKYGNVSGCGIFREGFYYFKDFTPRYHLPEIPVRRARYKAKIDLYQGKIFLVSLEIYGRIQNAE